MSQTELNRLYLLEQVLGGMITNRQAAFLLGISEHNVYRLKTKLKKHGPAFMAHGNRSRKPDYSIPENIRQQVVQLAQTKYRGCNFTFLSKLLHENEGITLSPSSVSQILKAVGISSGQRMPQMGLFLQIDGSDASTLDEANAVLNEFTKEYNSKFAVQPITLYPLSAPYLLICAWIIFSAGRNTVF
ncbi:hypothetical protein [Thermovenabulum sp.]|uniref:hypothetical protein n=1 Tax=Thermovenabulum sp. TaxID=3100335 RepID=UPI003C7C4D7E